ncbi:zf-TFIIB domain-containing protein [Sinisalibacter aestuarii]|uniref:Transcription factor zinc-finger domain-containing protein n=1 Tax=Sinisalibacter aestuarii TaxID=2949426 RepID=A0ABQ5LTK9_9RHOB|nr:zf-TFIIB domain-containing protein [Sinisalibacter aestuarii]GKY88298.1 hypothetical protein STA1M1_21670 [Sinisalibacter aestuarii]
MKCPHDATEMDHVSRHGVEIDHCPACGGVWLDGGELDHLIAALRPAIELDNPDPAPPPPPRPAERKGKPYAPAQKRAERFEDRGREVAEPGKGKRYGGRYSGKARLRNILEEIFDFD